MSSFQPVVRSLLENDLYKFTMWQALLHQHPGASAEYGFVCRSATRYPLAELREEVERQLDHLCSLSFTEDELAYLRGLRFIKGDFVDFLSVFRFQRRFIKIGTEGDKLTIHAEGPLVHVMGFEIFVLYIVNEVYFRRIGDSEERLAEGRRRLAAKVELVKAQRFERRHPYTMSDFGLRRRYSGAWQDEVVGTLLRELPQYFTGTSNVHLARTLGILPIGTMAHEYLQAFQALGFRLRDSQRAALEGWVHEYRGDLGIALTDVIGMDAFLVDFDLYFAKLFDGLRHDSGDPFEWGEKALAHYQKLRIDANTKRLVFSDALDFPRSFALYERFADRIVPAFGIGTHLTNDTGVPALNVVMKMLNCNGQPTAKLSDSPGKTLCDDAVFLAYLRQVFNKPE